jgi:hypothetical protein
MITFNLLGRGPIANRPSDCDNDIAGAVLAAARNPNWPDNDAI